jgi:hypothetical protein
MTVTKKRAELFPHIEGWLNKTVASSTGYSSSELIFGERSPSIFVKMLPEVKTENSDIEDIDTKLKRVFSRIKRKAVEREKRRKKRNTSWNGNLDKRFLVKCQNHSDATKIVIDKFMHLY